MAAQPLPLSVQQIPIATPSPRALSPDAPCSPKVGFFWPPEIPSTKSNIGFRQSHRVDTARQYFPHPAGQQGQSWSSLRPSNVCASYSKMPHLWIIPCYLPLQDDRVSFSISSCLGPVINQRNQSTMSSIVSGASTSSICWRSGRTWYVPSDVWPSIVG